MSFQGVDPVAFESVSQTTLTNTVDLGTRRWVDGEEYVYLYNAGGASITATYGCCKSAITGPYSVTVSSVTTPEGQPLFAVVKHSTVPTAAYFWGLVKGQSQVENGATLSLVTDQVMYLAASGMFVHHTISTDAYRWEAGIVRGAGTIAGGSCTAFIKAIG